MVFFIFCFYFGKILAYVPLMIFFPTKVIGKQNLPKNQSVIVVCNHLSWVDILILWMYIPGFRRFVAKEQVGKWWSKGFVSAIGTVFLDREGADLKAIKRCIAVLKKGQSLNIFPEGTRNRNGTTLQPIKRGVAMFAIKGNATVVPVIIKEKSRIFKKNSVQIGQPIKFEQYNGKCSKDNLNAATEQIKNSLLKTQKMIN
ncbi:MAG: 1-acyl-sn-glycerol-3-phosphate acyltransferase [Clostridiales bacterium]|jgi:1-acyl-sn-glycerol-3-phosphate acyltransferase|nr:1-acyl-sn-glycerol-3-phosphate acyltransferase [Clostridiales bacterium]